ncbi:MAG TPA: hypothetical protein VHF06_35055 [Pseudonocardiaceae bacterium]|nr:hypothetical protein [Pseudonocardiaceae bacterium]
MARKTANTPALVLAMGRLGIGVVATVAPATATRLWLGAAPSDLTRMLGRSLGGRDFALAAGALLALAVGEPADVRRWVRAGAVADAVDALATVACWSSLPRANRVATLVASAGAAALGLTAVR